MKAKRLIRRLLRITPLEYALSCITGIPALVILGLVTIPVSREFFLWVSEWRVIPITQTHLWTATMGYALIIPFLCFCIVRVLVQRRQWWEQWDIKMCNYRTIKPFVQKMPPSPDLRALKIHLDSTLEAWARSKRLCQSEGVAEFEDFGDRFRDLHLALYGQKFVRDDWNTYGKFRQPSFA
jgi:hypothetical protein